MSYGTKYWKADLAKEYLSRIKEYLLFEKQLTTAASNDKKIEWLTDNLNYRSTKNEAKSEITNGLRRNNIRNKRKANSTVVDLSNMNSHQRARLTSFVRSCPSVPDTWYYELYNPRDLDFLPLIVDRMEYHARHDKHFNAFRYLNLLVKLDESGTLKKKIENWKTCLSQTNFKSEILSTAISFALDLKNRYDLQSLNDRTLKLSPKIRDRNRLRYLLQLPPIEI